MTAKTNLSQNIFRVLLGVAMLYAGIGHLSFRRTEFLAQVPTWLTTNPEYMDIIVLTSGIIEVVFGIMMIIGGKFKVKTGILLAIFYVLIFPGNINQYVNNIDAFGLNTDKARLIRMFFQPLLILWALWSSGALTYLKNRKKRLIKLRILILLISTVISTTQCKTNPSNKTTKENSLENKKWFLKEFDGKTINKKLDDYYILFNSNNNELVTEVGCNSITSNYEMGKSSLKINKMASTRMACNNEKINETEYTQKIETVKTFSIDNNTLTLKGNKDQIIAIYSISEE